MSLAGDHTCEPAVSLSGSLCILDSRLYSPAGPVDPLTDPARGKFIFSQGGSTDLSQNRQAEVGDHFGHPQGVQVDVLNSTSYVAVLWDGIFDF